MRSFAAVVLTLATSALAYTVTSPAASTGWTTSGAQTLSWTRVSSDPTNFTAVLVNDADSTFSDTLATNVDGTLGTLSVSPPSSGWPTGTLYRVNLVTAASAILAQSAQFNFTASTSSSSSSTGSSSGSSGSSQASASSNSASLRSATGSTLIATATSAGSGSTVSAGSTATSSAGTEASTSANAALPIGAPTGVIGVLLAVVGVFFA